MRIFGRFFTALVFLSPALLLQACSGGTEGGLVIASLQGAEDEVVEVTITANNTFSPADITIAAGTTVRWTNEVDAFQTITPDGHSEWTATTMSQAGETFEHRFDTPGYFPYYSAVHREQGMNGSVTVE